MEDNQTIIDRQMAEKTALLDILKEMPIIQVACKKAGVSRATYYRWRNEDQEFAQASTSALKEGVDFINDMSESQIIQLIKEKRLPAIALWLKHNNPRYGGKSVSRTPPSALATLTPDETKLFRKALALSAGINPKNHVKRNQTERPTKNIVEQKPEATPSL
jgi:hypothetical protein